MPDRFDLDPGSLVGRAVAAAREAVDRADPPAVDRAYREAVALAPEDGTRDALAVDHAAALLELGAASAALARCDEYLREAGGAHPGLLLLRAEIRGSVGDHGGAAADAVALRGLGGPSSDGDRARVLRVEALAAADRGEFDLADRAWERAGAAFRAVGDDAGVAIVDRDRLAAAVRLGDAGAVSAVVSAAAPRTVADHLLLAAALRRDLRYEEALHVVVSCVADTVVDPALRLPLLREIVVLLWATRQEAAVARLEPLLREAVADSPDPVAAGEDLDGLFPDTPPGGSGSTRFGRRIEEARRLLVAARLDEAEALLVELRDLARAERDVAGWHLVAGEVELARHRHGGDDASLRQAVLHLDTAAERAGTTALAEIRVVALRLSGRASFALGDEDRAGDRWIEAHAVEERVAERQVTDQVRVGMLLSAPDEHDERVRAAAEAVDRHGAAASAAVVVAMETARGATILGSVLPEAEGFARTPPRLRDLHGAWRWLGEQTRDLPRSQVVWMVHATPHRVHHAVIGRGALHHLSVALDRTALWRAVDELMACWTEGLLDEAIASGDFDGSLARIADHLDVGAVLDLLPRGVRRIALVAGGVLAGVPFAAMTVPGTAELVCHRYALSDLPCLSARRPLRLRSAARRGDRALLVSPPGTDLARAADLPGRVVLESERVTPDEVRAALESRSHHQVRIDTHGCYDHADPTGSWLRLGPEGAEGRVRPDQLQWMDLRGCGTFVLGACETGMALPRGRDERVGFVRAAIHAGAASVVAATWIADAPVAAAVLDRFDRYLRYLPRDVALQRAQLDVARGAWDPPADLEHPHHPARWACWVVCGASDRQTGAGPVRRLLRRELDRRRHRAADRSP
ncbi:CHAT domain-containing protein [Umezawaea sp.]|uniref:CHAT domain-containing protein n=1 Tax=Umezawaea sp. TaxID=1955258 RepID=UPI002ED6804F